jgi:hypothetical protein
MGVTEGMINTNVQYDSYFYVYWRQIEQKASTNKTKIVWSCGVSCGHDFYRNAIRMSPVVINGEQVYDGGTYSNFDRGRHDIASGFLEIEHDSDGKKTFTVSAFTGWLYSNNNYSSSGQSFDLPDIPRQATLDSANDFNDEENPTITFSNAGNFPINARLEFAGTSIHREDIENTGSYTFDLTEAERELLRQKCIGNTMPIRLVICTKINSTKETNWDWEDKTFYMTENEATKPIVSISAALNNGSLPSKFNGMYIQGKSRLDVSISAQGKYSAKIISYSANIGGEVYNSNPFLSNVISKEGKVDVIGYAKDSRQFTGSVKQQIEVTEYSKPLVIPLGKETAIQCYRSDGNGKRIGNSTSVWVKAKMTHYSLSGKNQCALQWRKKLITEIWDEGNAEHQWKNLISKGNTTTAEYNALLPSETFDLRKSYSVQIRTIDDIGEYDLKNFEIPTQDVALHLGKGGKNVSVGTYCDYSEDYTFYSKWKAIFDKGFVDGTDIGWQPINNYISYRAKCGYVTIVGISHGDIVLTKDDYTIVGKIPKEYAPTKRVPIVFHTIGGSPLGQSGFVEDVGDIGDIRLYTNVGDTSYWAFSVTYPL